jgi:hypothetical protein
MLTGVEVSRLGMLTAQAEDDDPLHALTASASLRREVERLEAVQVRRARTRGASWAEIATALGVSRQAVHKKHGVGFRGRNA